MESIQNEFISKEQVVCIIQELVEKTKPIKDYLTVEEMADYLGLSKSAVYKITSKKEIAFYNPGGKKIYFKKEEVDLWIESGRVNTDSEMLEQTYNKFSNSKTSAL